jgi:E3 ubiquitin-protein ligase BAH
MKFAHEFKEALEREGFPSHWVESAIPYGQLKKCIKKVERELRGFGLDSQTLGLLMSPDMQEDQSSTDGSPVGFQYKFAGERVVTAIYDLNLAYDCCLEGDSEVFRPTLTLYIQRTQGSDIAIDATLSPSTRHYLQNLADAQARGQKPTVGQSGEIDELKSNSSLRSE